MSFGDIGKCDSMRCFIAMHITKSDLDIEYRSNGNILVCYPKYHVMHLYNEMNLGSEVLMNRASVMNILKTNSGSTSASFCCNVMQAFCNTSSCRMLIYSP